MAESFPTARYQGWVDSGRNIDTFTSAAPDASSQRLCSLSRDFPVNSNPFA